MEKIAREKLAAKVICVALALILWFYVSFQENPSMSKTVKNVPISIVGEQALRENGLSVYSVSVKSVDVKVTAKRLSLGRFSNKSLTASINVSSIKESGKHVIPATVNSTLTSNASWYVKGKDITVTVEPVISKNLSVEADISQSLDSSMALHSYKLSVNKVSVTAPKSIMDAIGSIKTESIVPTFDESELTTKLVVYGKNGKILEGAECNPSEVTVKYSLHEVKTVPVVLKTSDGNTHTLPAEYVVKISGIGSEFEEIKEIPTEKVNIDALEVNSTLRIKLDIPSGVTLQSPSDKIEVELKEKYFE